MIFLGPKIIRRHDFSVTYSVYEAVSRRIIPGVWVVFVQELLLCPTDILNSSVRYNQHQLQPM
jgi:hypothetical protein